MPLPPICQGWADKLLAKEIARRKADVVEYRLMTADAQAASVSLLSAGLSTTTFLKFSKLLAGTDHAFSICAVYCEEEMTFELSAKLAVARSGQPPLSTWRLIARRFNVHFSRLSSAGRGSRQAP